MAYALCLAAPASAADDAIAAPDLFAKVKAAYASIESCRVEGLISLDFESDGRRVTADTRVTMLLQQPDRYLITMEMNARDQPTPGTLVNAAWSDGTRAYAYSRMKGAYAEIPTQAAAVLSTGLSVGAAGSLPLLMLTALHDQPTVLDRLIDPAITTGEVGGEACYIVTAFSMDSRKETLWVSQESDLILKHEYEMGPPEERIGARVVPRQHLEHALVLRGAEVNEENLEKERALAEQPRSPEVLERLRRARCVEVYTLTLAPGLTQGDFVFTPPEGSERKRSLYTDPAAVDED